MSGDKAVEALVLGIGNPLWGDEGFGLRALAAFEARWAVPEGVEVLDGGTQGMYLLPYVQAARRLLIFDAIDFSLPAGTPLLLCDDEVPRLMGARRLSLHQTTFQDVLAAATLLDGGPASLRLVGVQCLSLEDFGGGLSPEVEAQIGPAVETAAKCLAEWGLAPSPLQPGSTSATGCRAGGGPP
ncbi:MAG: HyaD/HybD family hydrogenase maturation endopeptidase [Solirubrobacterales bacterium]